MRCTSRRSIAPFISVISPSSCLPKHCSCTQPCFFSLKLHFQGEPSTTQFCVLPHHSPSRSLSGIWPSCAVLRRVSPSGPDVVVSSLSVRGCVCVWRVRPRGPVSEAPVCLWKAFADDVRSAVNFRVKAREHRLLILLPRRGRAVPPRTLSYRNPRRYVWAIICP